MMTATGTRQKAREALAGKWGKGALIALIYAIFSFILNALTGNDESKSTISLIISILALIINIPISYGLIVSFIKLKRNEEIGYFDFFKYGFNNFSRAWGIVGHTFIKMILPMIFIIISIIIMASSIGFSNYRVLLGNSSEPLSFLAIIGMVLYFVAIIYAIAKGLLYSLSNYIAYDNAEMSTKEAVEESARLMKGNRGSLFILELSFIGWAILTIFTLGIGALWLFPYMQVALVCFYEEVSQNKESNETEINLKK